MPVFSPGLFTFLTDLRANNDKEWFTANKPRFESEVKAPMASLVRELAPRLATIDPDASCDDRSVFRIYRDTRFSKDKSPYKTHVAAQFTRGGRGPSASGYYLHLEPGSCFLAAGLWMPEPAVATKIRIAIDARRGEWVAARDGAGRILEGESLKRVPAPWKADHPLADDLRRKGFCTSIAFTEAEVVGDDFVERVAEATVRMRPLVRFLDEATG